MQLKAIYTIKPFRLVDPVSQLPMIELSHHLLLGSLMKLKKETLQDMLVQRHGSEIMRSYLKELNGS